MHLNKTVPNHRVSAYAIHCVAIQNVRTAHPNAVFFPSAQMKNVRHKPGIPIETQAIPALTQTVAHHVEVAMSDLHLNCTNYIGISHAVSGNVPAAATPPRVSGEVSER